jgi:hypothetical protein
MSEVNPLAGPRKAPTSTTLVSAVFPLVQIVVSCGDLSCHRQPDEQTHCDLSRKRRWLMEGQGNSWTT